MCVCLCVYICVWERESMYTSSHLGLEHLDHVVEVAWTADLSQHVVQLALSHQLADVVEGGAEVVLGDGAILEISEQRFVQSVSRI